MTESTFTQALHRLLPQWVYRWKIADRFTAGIPDAWYSGDRGCLFVEYKYVPKLPKKLVPKLSALQTAWLRARHNEGRDVAVIVGSPDGCVIMTDLAWETPQNPTPLLRTRKQAAQWITGVVSTKTAP